MEKISLFNHLDNLTVNKKKYDPQNDVQTKSYSKYMINRLTEIAQEKGISGFIGEILAENYPMMHIIKSTPFNVEF